MRLGKSKIQNKFLILRGLLDSILGPSNLNIVQVSKNFILPFLIFLYISTQGALAATPVKKLLYFPTQSELWDQSQKAIEEGDYNQIEKLTQSIIKEKPSDSLEYAEAKYIFAKVLEKSGYPMAASHLLENISLKHMGTSVGSISTLDLSELDLQGYVDREDLIKKINSRQFPKDHPDLANYIHFYQGLHNLKLNLQSWARRSFSKIAKGSAWADQLDYWMVLVRLDSVGAKKSVEKLTALLKKPNLQSSLQQKINWTLARLQFQLAKFNEAELFYNKVQPRDVRETGRLSLERAWVYYYKKNYSKALGLLRVLDSPLFSSSIQLEKYILEMTIYKNLCLYPLVSRVQDNYLEVYGSSVEYMSSRKPLSGDMILSTMLFNRPKYESRARLVHLIDIEQDQLDKLGWLPDKIKKEIVGHFNFRKSIIKTQLRDTMEPDTRILASHLLDKIDQIKYLDFTAKLDSLRIANRYENRSYKSEEISKVSFDKLYWPLVKHEIWKDEIEGYEAIVSSRCGGEVVK
jgi:hypothetical protein